MALDGQGFPPLLELLEKKVEAFLPGFPLS
jgi:hypothetical protein